MNLRIAVRMSLCLLVADPALADTLDERIYMEFLWAKTPDGALARQQTRQFVTASEHGHQVCVAAPAAKGLELLVLDAKGREMSRQRDPDFSGRKHCYPAVLGRGGSPGQWTVRAILGDGRSNEGTVLVHARLEDSPSYRQPQPYVLGRPNYDDSIPPQQWSGRLVWAMTVDAQGWVTDVVVEEAVGVGERLRERAIAAGYLSLFPPGLARESEPLVWRRQLDFAPD